MSSMDNQPATTAATAAADLLAGPGPTIAFQRLDFAATPLREYAGKYAVILDNVLSADECTALARAAEAHAPYERALVNVGQGRQEAIPMIRSCDRVIWDDAAVVRRLWQRVAPFVPELRQLRDWADVTGPGPAKRGETWTATRLNERMRFLRYGPGEYFHEHVDGSYVTPDETERSYFTLHLYLNEAGPDNPLKGGATTFFSPFMEREFKVRPKMGRVLIFQHRSLKHAGEEVTEGMKVTMRTDLMFRFEGFS